MFLVYSPHFTSNSRGEVAMSAGALRIRAITPMFSCSFKSDPGGSSAGGPSVRQIPSATKLADYFSISPGDGDYNLDTLMELAKVDGRPMMFSVGKPLK